MPRKQIEIAVWFAATAVALLVISGTLNTTLGPSVTYQANISFASGQVREHISAWSRYDADIGRADYVIGGIPSTSTIYFYFDPTYPSSYSTNQYWFGLSQLIAQLASERGMGLEVVLLTASELQALLVQPPPRSSVLVMASGVLPDTVFGPTFNDVTPWLRAGGVMIWAGDQIGAYSGIPAANGNPPVSMPMGLSGVSQFLNMSYVGSGGTEYLNQSEYSSAFNLVYSLSLGSFGAFNVAGVTAIGGVVLGRQSNNYTNLAVIPEGLGRLVDFSGPLWDLNALVQSMMNGIQSGAFLFPFQILGDPTVHLQANAQVRIDVSYDVPLPTGSEPLTTFCSFAFETGTFAQFAHIGCTNLT